MASSYHTRSGRTTKRGLFLNGVWHCDCEPRMPADKFQVKNGGKNHGRWFYTCQKPQHKRCKFFLWTDDAKVREAAAVLGNSRSEPPPPRPQTPPTLIRTDLPPTPDTKTKKTFATSDAGHGDTLNGRSQDESFEWSSSNDEELLKVEQELLRNQAPFETPKKAPRTERLTSPGKHALAPTTGTSTPADDTWPLSDDVFATPSTSHRSGGSTLPSPNVTPAHGPTRPLFAGTEPSALASDVLTILRGSTISAQVETELVDMLNKCDLRTQGIIKGRDITRLAVQAKDQKIADLQARIAVLEAERETNRAVIHHLKHDMATSPRKGRGRGGSNARGPPL